MYHNFQRILFFSLPRYQAMTCYTMGIYLTSKNLFLCLRLFLRTYFVPFKKNLLRYLQYGLVQIVWFIWQILICTDLLC